MCICSYIEIGELMKKVLLSDIDGTLVDSNALHAEAWRRAFAFWIEVGLDEAWRQIGKGDDQLVPAFVSAQDRKRLEDRIKRYREALMKSEYGPRMVPFPKARELLERVRVRGMRSLLATSAKADDLGIYKRLVGMEDL
jgi:beta-phosphoglucomutase-like phosphatase (HAD superfamily)